MLVLSRHEKESIVIPGCGVTITVESVIGKRVKLGISAPPSVAVHRSEVWEKIQQECAADPEVTIALPVAGCSLETV